MENAANKVASMLQEMPANYNFFVGTIMSGTIDTIKETLGCDVIIVNQWQRVVQSTLKDVEIHLPEESLKTVFNGKTYRRQAVLIEELGNSYTVGVPINGESETVIGGVFVTARQVRVGSAMQDILVTFLLCGLAVLMVACVVLYFITYQITKPLYEMAQAARDYTKGDFSGRIIVPPEGELRTLAITFNQMADGLDRLETMRRGFIADVSHELRTPMTTIGGFIDGILDGTIPEESKEKYLLLVSDEVRRLTRMVNNLLDVARIQSGEISYQMVPFDLVEVAHRVLLTMQDRVEHNNIQLSVDLPEESLFAVGDRDAIYRVIYNLVDNAVKFTPANGEIAVSVKRTNEKIHFSVRNTGQGIPQGEAGQIFERFYKTDKSREGGKKGVGLGLYMVKTIIDAHGENIVLTSKEGSFAEFTFTLREAKEDF